MGEQILESIVELLRAGGAGAIWVYAIWTFSTLLKYVIGFGFITLGIVHVSNTLRQCFGKKNSESEQGEKGTK